MHSIIVLIWKHMVVRKRRFILTFIDFFNALTYFLLLFFLKGYINPATKLSIAESFSIQETEPIDITALPRPTTIFYSPDTDLTGLLMDQVGESLKLNRKIYTTGAQNIKGYMPITNISELLKSDRKFKDTDALVLFENMNGTWPEHLSYTIRMRGDFQTQKLNADDGSIGPHERFGSIYEPFIRLQWAIDSSYLQLLSGDEIKQRVMLQEFPYVRASEMPTVKVLCALLPVICWISLLLTFIFVMSKLLEERITGIQELIKMVGVSNATLNLSHFLNIVPVLLIYSIGATILLTVSSSPVIPNTNPLFIVIFLALYFTSVFSMAYASSYLIQTTQYATSLASLIYIALWLPTNLVKIEMSWTILLGLLPFMPLKWFWMEVGELEAYGKGADFGSIMKKHVAKSAPIAVIYLLLVIQTLLFMLLGWYLSQVNPGPYSQSQPWNFLCSKSFWSKKKVEPVEEEEEELREFQNQNYFEAPPKDMHPGIRILNVSKVFGSYRALSGVSLDVYRGEITVLLGHNGAGKTTLMSIITGMLNASDGKVLVEGYDTVKEKAEMRKLLGLCPQHNLFFPDLTVLEHVMFFTLLKGSSYSAALSSSKHLVSRLGLSERSSQLSKDLSGGMQRRLQLGCALAGEATVLILDEPTSGLDVETRRELWDLLLSLRGSRTVVLSTHFMEEADALGDRVAALHAGRLVCHATTMHLKKAIGTGYRLSLTTVGLPREETITAAIVSVVSGATLKEKSLNSISYSLPAADAPRFPKLFNLLESKRSELGINTIGVGISTLEDVFLKICSDTTTTFTVDEIDGGTTESTYNRYSGIALYTRQFKALFYRQMQYMYSKKISFIIMNVMLPIIFLGAIVTITNDSKKSREPKKLIALDLDLYRPQEHRRVLLHVEPGTDVRTLGDAYPDVDFEVSEDIPEALLRKGKKDIFEYNKYLGGIEINETHANALYSTLVRHAAPVSVGLLANALATRALPATNGRTLTAHLDPLQDPPEITWKEPKSTMSCLVWSMGVGFVVIASLINYVSLPCLERSSGRRHALSMAGASPILQWAATLTAHMVPCSLVLLLPALLITLLDSNNTLNRPEFVGTMFVLLLVMMLAFLALSYFVSFAFEERGATTVLSVLLIFFGVLTPSMNSAADSFGAKPQDVSAFLLKVAMYTMPPHCGMAGAIKATYCAHVNALCSLNRGESCSMPSVPGMDVDKCCVQRVNPRCYFCFNKFSPMEEILVLIVQFVVYMVLVYLAEIGVFNVWVDRILNNNYRPTTNPQVSPTEMVAAEKQYVDKAIKLPPRDIPDALLVHDVHKRHFSLFNKAVLAVKGVSFSVKKGECFGLLGANGAGKTSTFKMLAGVDCATRGSVVANGHLMSRASTQYLQSFGYCPQFMGLDGFLSGRDNLALLLTLWGLSRENVARESDIWIHIVGLESYGTREISRYSGGMARRVAAAAALCTGARVALLDEPTAGVDVAARRRVWAALRRAQSERAIVITSHSMDEMEALCSRIGIMTRGVLRALGSAAGLRAEFTAGHAVRIKLSPAAGSRGHGADETDTSTSEVVQLKEFLHGKFNCTLRDEHKTMLHYHINDTMSYSQLFSELERLKSSFPSLVEDYDLTETTLEEVFLTLAKESEDTSV